MEASPIQRTGPACEASSLGRSTLAEIAAGAIRAIGAAAAAEELAIASVSKSGNIRSVFRTIFL